MSTIQETLFDLFINALIQIGVFAIVAAGFSRLAAKARAKHQFLIYLAVLLFSLAVPVVNTLWHSPLAVVANRSQQWVLTDGGGVSQSFWTWQRHAKQAKQFILPAGFQSWILDVWGFLVLLRLARLGLAVHRVIGVRRDAFTLSPAQARMASRITGPNYRVALLQSTAIDDPVTVGVFHPAILLPSKVLPDLDEQELLAILAHEYGHIHRRDFLVHTLCEFISVPVAWHPGIGYLMSKISQARELACDDYAASRVGSRRWYANTLLRLASLCLHVPRADAVGLGLFDGDSLETRIMKLTEKTRSLSRTAAIGLALAMGITFGAGEAIAQTISRQASSKDTAEKFIGTWHWKFDGRSFATMVLVRSESGLTGTVTGSRIALDDEGGLSQADPSEDSTPKPIAKARLEGSALHITVSDGFEFLTTVKDDTHAEIRPVGSPPNMKPIPAEKVH